ncbi:malto-oligosyltrehalose synthase [Prosthecobacter sp.]|uniref:malto-oligosyltrehalose synthase n=1 Tax=Prosthecobacter sp. TaxID=1965333 RepID=UPI003783CA34
MSVIPTATYRLQFQRCFTFSQAKEVVHYLARLGISHVYASPFFRAAPGSTHGYDVYDHNELNPEIGTREEFEAFSAELKAHGLGLIVDFVPNHMGIEHAMNPWWRDVLKNGPASAYARFFDIDWQPLKSELTDKVLLPVLGEQYGRTLEGGGFRLMFADGEFTIQHDEYNLPLAPRTTRPLLRQVVTKLTSAPAELESILTAIEHLPPRTETDPDRIAERVRECGVIRERLKRLCAEVPEVGEAILGVVAAWNDPEDEMHFDRMDELLGEQSYRLSSWRVAAEEINYRRFFDVNTLAAIRMELPEVFEATHRLLFELIDAGHLSGVRIDHIDGLAYPKEYLQRLRERGGDGLYLLVEKILGRDEKLRADWPVQGTTGYEFANQLVQMMVPAQNDDAISAAYERLTGAHADYAEIVYRSKKLVMESSMASEVNVLGTLLDRISESHRWYRDFTVNALTMAVREVIACFPVYRTYLDPAQPADETDRRVISRALALARRRNQALERSVFDFLRDVLLLPKDNAHPVDEELRRKFVLKFQQSTGPITAKGVEDTAFYVYNRLVALNEVGGEPVAGGATLEAFHRLNEQRQAALPHCMLTTSTHDTKRSEDTRARVAALAEMPEEWSRAVRRWQVMNRKHRRLIDGEVAPDANEEYLLYQTLAGAWPLEGLHEGNRAEFVQRMQDYMLKAGHEAKVNSSWIEPNVAWDGAVSDFIAEILASGGRNRFPQSVALLVRDVEQAGAINSLTQTVLKLTCPGVPDIYQGCELWDLSLVDPDNRRAVDFPLRQQRLDGLGRATPQILLEHWRDGRIKMLTIHQLLKLRKEKPTLFTRGSYAGLTARGVHADKVVAFERREGDEVMLVIVPRHAAELGFPPVGAVWGDTEISVPHVDEAGETVYRDVFTGREFREGALGVKELLGEMPFGVLVRERVD